ncbi:MAG: hypothetical protein ACRDD8_02860 [Bacteroidales bacterium]
MKFTVNNREFEFLCYSKSTRNGFKHECDLFIDGRRFTSAKINYLNRTWENYEYQSVMKIAIDQVIASAEEHAKFQVKNELGVLRMTKKANEMLSERMNDNQLVVDCREILKQL